MRQVNSRALFFGLRFSVCFCPHHVFEELFRAIREVSSFPEHTHYLRTALKQYHRENCDLSELYDKMEQDFFFVFCLQKQFESVERLVTRESSESHTFES